MTVWLILLIIAVAITAFSAVMVVINLSVFPAVGPRAVPPAAEPQSAGDVDPHEPLVSICIPARNEAENIEACVRGLLAQRGASVELLIYDDGSTDGTGEIAARLAAEDARVRLVNTVPLPAGWNGKQHGCQRMGEAARGSWLLFTDADVRFEPDAVAVALSEASRLRADLVSTFPRQITGSLVERLVVPFIHFILLSYLPFPFMRSNPSPSASAGCGQFLLVRREWWSRSGGHAAFRASMHDGIRLPRSVRAAGGRSDLFDGTSLVSCRMYRDASTCWRGFAKNAYEGLGSFTVLCVFTLLHLLGHVLPWIWLIVALVTGHWQAPEMALALTAIGLALGSRLLLARRFRQSLVGVVLHPVGLLLVTAIQWHSFKLHRSGRREWRGRVSGSLQQDPASGMLSGHG
ncbi:MAG: glycosyltransferase [Phycisphaeraceae bacterium]|nr:glycosyltransferase [Phycisphaeraceae bacterium]